MLGILKGLKKIPWRDVAENTLIAAGLIETVLGCCKGVELAIDISKKITKKRP